MTDRDALQPGDTAPDFTLPDHDGAMRSLSDFAGRKLVLFFYPRADTPGCTTEAQDFTARTGDFAKSGTAIVGISADPPGKLAKFRNLRGLSVMLLSDEAQTILKAYGVWGEKSMYGKTFEGILRTTFLIGHDGAILEIWRGVKVPDTQKRYSIPFATLRKPLHFLKINHARGNMGGR